MISHDRMKKIMNLAELFKTNFPNLNFHFNYPLAAKSYFKIGGNAEVFYSAQSRQEVIDLLSFCHRQQINFYILGGASNVIIADEGLRGFVLNLDFKELQILDDQSDKLIVRAEAGMKTAHLVAQAANYGGSGLEGFIGVPGTLGGAIYNNAHYLDNLIGNHIREVEIFDVKKGEIVMFSHEKCEFAYEKSIFQTNKHFLIFSAVFALKKDSPALIKQRMQDSIQRREARQPLDLPSCGCVFQNPKNTDELKKLFPKFKDFEFIPSGFLIAQAAYKAERRRYPSM
jgi:UDP-N-acetylmuramate dehydrogenase